MLYMWLINIFPHIEGNIQLTANVSILCVLQLRLYCIDLMIDMLVRKKGRCD